MRELFLAVLNMSLTASYVILFLILIRLPLKKAPKFISYALWSAAAFRLIIPFSFESMFSLLPRNTNTISIPYDIVYQQSPQISSRIAVVDSLASESLPPPAIGANVNPLQIYIEIGTYIWVLGIIALLVYSLVSILILKRRLKSAQLIEKNIFETKNLKTPFVLGLIRPKIYLPVGLTAEERGYILLHEQTHIHRKDYIIKVLAFLLLSIHWFNPLVWIAFLLMSMDMELSCDERVLKEMDKDMKKPYANLLLSLTTGRHTLNGSPLAFGEGNVKGRIKNVLNYKRPRFWIVAAAIIAVITIGIGLISNPKSDMPSMMWAKSLQVEDIQSIELIVQPSFPQEQYKKYTADEFSEIVRVVNRSNGRLVKYPENIFGGAQTFYITTKDGAVHRFTNNGNRYLVIDGDTFEAEYEWLNMWKYKGTGSVPDEFQKKVEDGVSDVTADGADVLLESNVLKQTDIKPTAPEWSPEQVVSVDMAELDYASDDIVIFHDYFGLFVYDLNSLKVIRSLDLKPLDCQATQGDNYCDVSVSMDGNTVQLHPMSSENMFVYTVSDNILLETAYRPMDNPFRNQFVPIEEVVNSTKLGNYSHHGVIFDTGEYGYLHTEDGTIGELAYVRGDMIFRLFDINTSSVDSIPAFTEDEVTAARGVVEEYFRAIQEKDDEAILKTLTPMYNHPNVVLYGEETRTLTSVDYKEDDTMRKSYVESGRGRINKTKPEDVMVFRVSFHVKYPKGVSGSFNEGDYTNWSVILVREDKESSWLIDDQGY